MSTKADHGDVRLPAEKFYWAVIEATSGGPYSRWESRATRSTRLGYLLEASLPVPIEQVHSVFRRLEGGRVLACAMGRESVQHHINAGAVTLGPDAAPEFVSLGGVHGSINLLEGAFEAPAVRGARRRWAFQVGSCVLLIAAATLSGLEHRIAAEHRAVIELERAASSVYAQVLPDTRTGAQPPAIQFVGELRALRQTRRAGPAIDAPDAAETLAQLLVHWPRQVEAKTDSVVITPTNITVIASVPDHDQARVVAASLSGVPGWRAEQPQVSQARGAVRLTARWARDWSGSEVRQ